MRRGRKTGLSDAVFVSPFSWRSLSLLRLRNSILYAEYSSALFQAVWSGLCAAGLGGLARRIRWFPTLGRREERTRSWNVPSEVPSNHTDAVLQVSPSVQPLQQSQNSGSIGYFSGAVTALSYLRAIVFTALSKNGPQFSTSNELHKLVLKSASLNARPHACMHACMPFHRSSLVLHHRKKICTCSPFVFYACQEGPRCAGKNRVDEQTVQCWMRWTIGLVELSRSPPPAVSDMPDASTRRDAEWR